MAALDALLDGPRAQGAFLLKAVFAGTWSITIEDEAPLSVVVVAQGGASLSGPEGRYEVSAGDVIVARGADSYVVADSAATPPDIRILPGQVCVDPTGAILSESMSLGVRTWGNTRESSSATVMLIGTYERETSLGALLLSHLPATCVLHEFDPVLVDLLRQELDADRAGQSAVLDRLLDLVLVTALRSLLADSPVLPGDPYVAEALRAIEEHPEHAWTVAALGDHVGLSRSSLARRFSQAVGEPPLSYLTRWRLALAADLLADSDLTLASIATRVGYANPFALSSAFKRSRGVSPQRFRASARTLEMSS